MPNKGLQENVLSMPRLVRPLWPALCCTDWRHKSGDLPVLLCLMLKGCSVRGAGYDMLGRVECTASIPGTVEVEGERTALHPAPYGSAPLLTVCAPAYDRVLWAQPSQ